MPRAVFSVGIQRYFEISVYLLVVAGFVTLASTGGLDLAILSFAGFALLLRGYGLVARQPLLIPEAWTTSLTLGYVAFYLADYFLDFGRVRQCDGPPGSVRDGGAALFGAKGP